LNPGIGFCTLEGSHTGANIAEIVIEVLQEYGIEEKLGYFIGDNTGNNDTLVIRHPADTQMVGNRLYNASKYRLRWVDREINH
jgi:hypothetical protein